MSAVQSLATLWVIYLGVALSPGVNFALIGQTATRHQRRDALMVAGGIVSASAIWMFAALFGLTAMIERAGGLFDLIRMGAAAYLVILGIQKLRSKPIPVNEETDDQPIRSWGHFSAGILTNLGNPKSILFYGSLFAAAFPAQAAIGLRMTGALLVLATSVAIHAGLASVLSIDRVRLGYLRLRRPIDRVFGVLFVAFGIRLLASEA